MLDKDVIEKIKRSDGKQVKLYLNNYPVLDKKESLIDYIKNAGYESVLHIGFAGHPRGIRGLIESNSWFHKKIEDRIPHVVGIDINSEAVGIAKDCFPEGNYYAYDAITQSDEVKKVINSVTGGGIDTVLFLPDVLEHICDPAGFLSGIQKNYSGYHLLVSVPNVFGISTFKEVYLRNYQDVNCDHKFFYDPYSFLNVLFLSGIEVEEFFFCELEKKWRIFKKPQMAGCLVAFCKL